MAIKRDALDSLFSDLIRERNCFICERCGIDKSSDKVNAHCAHVLGRRITRLRHDPRNALMLCASCHFYMTDRPIEWTCFVRELLGHGIVDELVRLSNDNTFKTYKNWKVDARKHYRLERDRMKAAGAEDYSGRFEIIGYW